MDLKKFKKLRKKFSVFPLDKEIVNTEEYKEYMDAFFNNKECQEWALKKQVKEAGINYHKYCCLDMAYHLIEDKKSKELEGINYDCIITHDKKRKTYGLPIHDGGSSYIEIKFCPWCGSRL